MNRLSLMSTAVLMGTKLGGIVPGLANPGQPIQSARPGEPKIKLSSMSRNGSSFLHPDVGRALGSYPVKAASRPAMKSLHESIAHGGFSVPSSYAY